MAGEVGKRQDFPFALTTRRDPQVAPEAGRSTKQKPGAVHRRAGSTDQVEADLGGPRRRQLGTRCLDLAEADQRALF